MADIKGTVADKQEIAELTARYLFTLDEKAFAVDELAHIFTSNARVKLPSMPPVDGLQDISRLHVELLGLFESTHHLAGGLVFDFTDDSHAGVKCSLSVWHKFNEAMKHESGREFLIVRDVLKCEVQKVKDEWRISDLVIKCIYRKEE